MYVQSVVQNVCYPQALEAAIMEAVPKTPVKEDLIIFDCERLLKEGEQRLS